MGARYQLDAILEWDQRIFFFSFFLYMVGNGIFHTLRSLLEWRDRKWSYHKKMSHDRCMFMGERMARSFLVVWKIPVYITYVWRAAGVGLNWVYML